MFKYMHEIQYMESQKISTLSDHYHRDKGEEND